MILIRLFFVLYTMRNLKFSSYLIHVIVSKNLFHHTEIYYTVVTRKGLYDVCRFTMMIDVNVTSQLDLTCN